jgi:hypothetical protein
MHYLCVLVGTVRSDERANSAMRRELRNCVKVARPGEQLEQQSVDCVTVTMPRTAECDEVLHLPQVLSQQQVARLIDSALTRFHRALLMTLYAAGGRRAGVALKDQRH